MIALNQNPYVKTDWSDHIVDPTQYEKDANGAVVTDPITGKPKPYVIQEGTRFTAGRANNIENGIYNAYTQLDIYRDTIQKLRVQIDMIGRAPINNGTFFDTLDGENTKQLARLTDAGVAQSALIAGATTITLGTAAFAVGDYVTIYDDAAQETAVVTAVSGKVITVAALANAYKKGARVERSNTLADIARQRLLFGSWGTYGVNITEVV